MLTLSVLGWRYRMLIKLTTRGKYRLMKNKIEDPVTLRLQKSFTSRS